MSKPKLLLLSVSAGAGHVRAAEALRAAAEARGVAARHLDVMEVVPRLFRKLYAESFISIVNRSPALWGYLYHSSDKARPDARLSRLRATIERLNARKLLDVVAEEQPTHIICTHFLPEQLLVRAATKGRCAAPLWTVVTDFDVHALWVQHGQRGICVASEEIAWRLKDRLAALPNGAQAAQTPLHVTGIPIAPAFSLPLDREACAAEIGLDPKRTTVLLMSGGMGVGAIDVLTERLLAIPGEVQFVALAGRNADLLARLRSLAAKHPERLFPLGFTTTPERIMACADVAITKPGGLTTSECLALGLPLLIVSPIPGQEERNSDYLLEHGAALKAHDAAGVDYRLRQLLAEPSRLQELRRNAKRLGKPLAAETILNHVLA